jgi:hypothetical protein
MPSTRQLALQRKGALWTERSSFFSHWQELSRFLLPRSGRFVVTDRNKGAKRFNNIYDRTATGALGTLAAGLMAGMTSPARPWFRLATSDSALMDYGPVKQWLDEVTTLMREVFNESNTYRALHGLYEEIACFGTGADFLLEDFEDVIRHYPLTVGEYALAANDRQEVDTLCRHFEMTVSQVVKRYVIQDNDPNKKDWSKASNAIKSLYDNNNLDAWVPVIHLVEPRADRDTKARDSKNMPFGSWIFEEGGNGDNFLSESGYLRFPVLAPRWHALGGDVYATRCPGMEALGDIKQLQHGQLRKAQGIDYMAKPPLQVPAGMKSYEVDSLPGGITVSNLINGGVKPLFEPRIDLQYQLEDIRDVRERIRSTFFADLFLMIAADERSGVTAREIAERHEEKLLMLGPVLERLHNELLKQKIDITFDKMLAAGVVPKPPQEMNGQKLNVQFVSMLAQAQRAIGTQSVDRYVGSLGTIAQFKPGVLDKFDEDVWADKYADMLGIDPDLIVGSDKVAIVREQRAKQQQAAQQMAAAEQMANTAKAASQASTSGPSALTDVIGAFSGYGGPGLPVAA